MIYIIQLLVFLQGVRGKNCCDIVKAIEMRSPEHPCYVQL